MAITKLNNTTEVLRSEATISNMLISESINKLAPIITNLYDDFDRDTTNLKQFIRRGTRKDIYGRVPSLINKLVSLYVSPIVDGPWEADKELELQDQIIDTLNDQGYPVTHDMLLDIKDFKGYTTFITDDNELLSGQEPQYTELQDSYIIVAEALNLPAVDFKLTPEIYTQAEHKALAKAKAEQEAINDALTKAKELANA